MGKANYWREGKGRRPRAFPTAQKMKVATTTADFFVAPAMLRELMERARDIEMLDPPARNPVHVYLFGILLAA